MPFTASHAVLALPFIRTPLLPAAIAVGAMAPDLPLFLRGTPLNYDLTHTNIAVSATLALALLVLWYALLRPAVRGLSPHWLAARLPAEWDRMPPLPRRARRWVWLAVSLVLGVISHVAWDAFTHDGRGGVRLVPALDRPWGPLTGYKWLQHGSSALGLLVLATFAAVWLARRRPVAAVTGVLPTWLRWAGWLALAPILVTAWAIGFAAHGPFTAGYTPQHLAYQALPPACAVWAAVMVALCVVDRVVRVRAHDRAPAGQNAP
ncbi:DUF4184 family protein [Microbacterium kribbense]|uniref:DUF4184 family protein n=1 Tax=Microbacterium kribbense TaxID=433645 RepID=A0ABP7GED2_9MICO